MRWFVKAVVYATLLTWPGHLIARGYQGLLLAITGPLTGRVLAAPADGAVDLSAANLLTILVALCLASDFAPWPLRLRALAFGLPAMVAIEVATGIAGMSLGGSTGSRAGSALVLEGVIAQSLELSRWLAVPLLWGWLLGRYALRAGSAAPSARREAEPSAAGGAAQPRARR